MKLIVVISSTGFTNIIAMVSDYFAKMEFTGIEILMILLVILLIVLGSGSEQNKKSCFNCAYFNEGHVPMCSFNKSTCPSKYAKEYNAYIEGAASACINYTSCLNDRSCFNCKNRKNLHDSSCFKNDNFKKVPYPYIKNQRLRSERDKAKYNANVCSNFKS